MSNKTFKSDLDPVNPAMQFITPPVNPEFTPDEKPGIPPKGYKINPLYIETKSRRLQILMQPSLYNKVKTRAIADGLSINELIHSLLNNALTENYES